VAQLICEKIAMPIIQECCSLEELSITQRGENGFGSTNI
jgi:dUTPase